MRQIVFYSSQRYLSDEIVGDADNPEAHERGL
jgi:hypothetical protein